MKQNTGLPVFISEFKKKKTPYQLWERKFVLLFRLKFLRPEKYIKYIKVST